MTPLAQTFLDEIFPSQRADSFFEALFGGAEEGAYDIRLVSRSLSPNKAQLVFELHQRPGKCLACNLTYGLPQVFQRHPVINVKGIVNEIARRLGWDAEAVVWRLDSTREISAGLHCIPLIMEIT
ncbi:MAG: hypothetical protein ZNDK_0042 [Candidatus Desulfovibrio kirbyi]|jgi:hypothetical protein|uniref:Pancreas/duodenum homeobox protein 1 n=1 Tax=Candidatus Desulfovibrio kirbyi TaxID=2696086 RepID=A0A6L2R3X6_9BACT|nr:hypothetical protein [Desulfovibrio sp.]GFH62271.1 MAG: hypothetical protein ZNDK_0042 [Candidatus Desulfovibrio kirbyi]